MIPSILEDVQIMRHDGRFPVQLEVPASSTLTEKDIENILLVSSWDTRMRDAQPWFAGGRSVLIPRKTPIVKQGINLPSLQINGVCYNPLLIDKSGVCLKDASAKVISPSAYNFMDIMPKGCMETAAFRGRSLVISRPAYRPLRTYSATELTDTIHNTRSVDAMGLNSIVVPHVEAYGRYLSPHLAAEDGQFGFIVLPSPPPTKERLFTELTSALVEESPEARTAVVDAAVAGPIAALVEGLREVHLNAAHLQVHLSNVYGWASQVYLTDWTTMRTLGEDDEENRLNRSLDLAMVLNDMVSASSLAPRYNTPLFGVELMTTLCMLYSRATPGTVIDINALFEESARRYEPGMLYSVATLLDVLQNA